MEKRSKNRLMYAVVLFALMTGIPSTVSAQISNSRLGYSRVWIVSYGGPDSWQKLADSNFLPSALAFGDSDGDGITDIFRAKGTAAVVETQPVQATEPVLAGFVRGEKNEPLEEVHLAVLGI